MGKYYSTNAVPKRTRHETHPIWRGIGCILMVVIPLISFGIAEWFVQDPWSQQFIPYQLMGNPVISGKSILWKLEYGPPILNFIQSQENIYAVIVLTIFFILIIGSIGATINAYLYKYMGPPRYGPQDAPPPNIKVKKYKR